MTETQGSINTSIEFMIALFILLLVQAPLLQLVVTVRRNRGVSS